MKLQDEGGRQSTGIFSLAAGRYFIGKLKEGGHMTDAEYAAADTGLVASGLPEFTTFTDEELLKWAVELIATADSLEDAEANIATNVEAGMISPTDAERLRQTARDVIEDPTKAIPIFAEEAF
jgi:hypothetical protein